MSGPRPNDCGCSDFAASRRARARDARAPVQREWDSRMPLPAGTGVDRRAFLRAAGGGLLAVYGAERLGLTNRVLGNGIAEAAAAQPTDDRILVTLFLQGGIDALSLLAPVNDPTYQKLRPSLAVQPGSGATLTDDPSLEWNPAASPLADLHASGQLTVIPGVGYTDPDMSHFTSRHYWEVGALSTRLSTGWMGRYLDRTGSATNPLQGLSLDGAMNPTLATAKNPVAAIDLPQNFQLGLAGSWGDPMAAALDSAGSLGQSMRHHGDRAMRQVAEAASEVQIVHHALAPLGNDAAQPTYTVPVSYPAAVENDDLPQRLAGLAAMIAAGLPLKCVAITTDLQFDTHSAQSGPFNQGLTLVAESLKAFQADLAARGLGDRVLVQVWSEFGRRAQENDSSGTDHGASGASLLIGTKVAGGMLGEAPSLAKLDVNGNQIANVDFRGIQASIIEQWLGEDAAAVMPGARGLPRYQLLSSGSAA